MRSFIGLILMLGFLTFGMVGTADANHAVDHQILADTDHDVGIYFETCEMTECVVMVKMPFLIEDAVQTPTGNIVTANQRDGNTVSTYLTNRNSLYFKRVDYGSINRFVS